MSVTALNLPPEQPPRFGPETAAEVERVRSSGALGTTGRLVELFDYLAARSAEDRPPKEAEIALAVFGKADADSLRDDPVARVYIHRLRKRLDDFYLRNGTQAGTRLDIPKGDYRIICRPVDGKVDAIAAPAVGDAEVEMLAAAEPAPPKRRKWLVPLIAVAAVVAVGGNIAAWAVFANGAPPAAQQLSKTGIWGDIAASERPLLIVVGDYYMFGEYEQRTELKRLIRDFTINSKEDLVHSMRGNPGDFDKYSDVAMQYLPASAAYALADLAPLLRGNRRVQVQLSSELSSDRLKSDDIIYVGLLNSMGPLRDPVFAQSRFRFGENYDQIIDSDTGKTYMSEAFLAASSDQMYRDYGFFSKFKGPSGNNIVILSGSRDTAVMGVAEKMTRVGELAEVEKKTKGQGAFEMLFEVKGQKHVNLETRPVVSYQLDSSSIWTGGGSSAKYPPAN
jgi:hypothetical protein